MSIITTRHDPRDAPSCMVCGKPVDVNRPLGYLDQQNVVAHVDCWARWQTEQHSANGGRTYWSMSRVTAQIKRIERAPGVVRVLGFRRSTNPLTDWLEVDALMACTEPDGRYNPFRTTFTCTVPSPVATSGIATYNPRAVVDELLDGSPLKARIIRAR